MTNSAGLKKLHTRNLGHIGYDYYTIYETLTIIALTIKYLVKTV